jgi:Holliday junction resolvase RusA-like endonuclease
VRTKQGGIIASKAYRRYEKEAVLLIPHWAKKHISTPVNVKAVYYMKARRRVDLSNLINATDDVLVAAGVLEDDNRDIVAGHDGSRVLCDKQNPRTEITITAIGEGYEQWAKK